MEKTCGYLGRTLYSYYLFLFSVFFFFGCEKRKIDFVHEGGCGVLSLLLFVVVIVGKMKTVAFEWKMAEYIFQIGRDRHDNWALIDSAEPWDIWFHAEGAPSSHVVLAMDDYAGDIRKIPMAVLKRGAGLCKEHSSSKSMAKCSVIYTRIENLKKGREVGSVTISGEVKKFVL
jgi:hypothetical protein